MGIDLSRRGFLGGVVASAIAAPAIVRAASLMPARGIVMDVPAVSPAASPVVWAEWMEVTRKAFLPRLYVQLWVQTPLLSTLAELEAERLNA